MSAEEPPEQKVPGLVQERDTHNQNEHPRHDQGQSRINFMTGG